MPTVVHPVQTPASALGKSLVSPRAAPRAKPLAALLATVLPLAAIVCAGAARGSDLGECAGADIVETSLKNSTSSGYYIPGLKLIIMNRAALDAYAAPVKRFIFAHECAHADPAVAEDEAAADCAAARQGASEGWLGKPEVIQVCAHLARFPADATHAPIAQRCGQIRQCSGLWDAPPGKAALPQLEARVPAENTPLTRLARTMD